MKVHTITVLEEDYNKSSNLISKFKEEVTEKLYKDTFIKRYNGKLNKVHKSILKTFANDVLDSLKEVGVTSYDNIVWTHSKDSNYRNPTAGFSVGEEYYYLQLDPICIHEDRRRSEGYRLIVSNSYSSLRDGFMTVEVKNVDDVLIYMEKGIKDEIKTSLWYVEG